MAAKKKTQKPRYVVIRTYSAGVHIGEVVHYDPIKSPSVIEIANARRLWNWREGRLSLHEVAAIGAKPEDRISVTLPGTHTIVGVIEILQTTAEAEASFRTAPAYAT
jgi:hypothetical protein